jgi:hypothetical protein
MLRCRALESNNLKLEGQDFLASCAALMEQFSVSARDLVKRLKSNMFELANGQVNTVSDVSGRHIDAVRRQLEKKRKQEEQYDPIAEVLKAQQRPEAEKQPKKNIAVLDETDECEYVAQRQRQGQAAIDTDHLAMQHLQSRNSRLRNERSSFEETCRMCTFPSVKSTVWVGVPPASAEQPPIAQPTFPTVTVVVEVVRKLSKSFWPVSDFVHQLILFIFRIRCTV